MKTKIIKKMKTKNHKNRKKMKTKNHKIDQIKNQKLKIDKMKKIISKKSED